jgi:hypothetical protein
MLHAAHHIQRRLPKQVTATEMKMQEVGRLPITALCETICTQRQHTVLHKGSVLTSILMGINNAF